MDGEALIRSRLNTRIQNARRYAQNEADDISGLVKGLNFAAEPIITLGQAERLAKAAVDLVRHLSTIAALDEAYQLLGDDE
jgi:hypothetical protein